MILDVGCGKHKRGDIGVDCSRDSCADVIADAHCLPFKGNVFDKILSFTVLEHSPNPLKFLNEQFRVLKQNGTILCMTDNAQYYGWSVLNYGGTRHADFHKDHYLIFFPENVKRLMKLAGFTSLKFKFVKRKRRKYDFLVMVLIKLRIFRKECLYHRFMITGKKY